MTHTELMIEAKCWFDLGYNTSEIAGFLETSEADVTRALSSERETRLAGKLLATAIGAFA